MTKEQAIEAMENGDKITHSLFTDEEFIFIKNGEIHDENGYKMRMGNVDFWTDRTHECWQDGYSLFKGNEKKQTDNSNIVLQEILEDAARFQYKNVGYNKEDDGELSLYIKGAELGANWQKEQLQPLIDSHAEMRQQLQSTHSFLLDYYSSPSIKHTEEQLLELRTEMRNIQALLEKANNIKP